MHLAVTQCTLLLAFVTTHMFVQPAAAVVKGAETELGADRLYPQYTRLKLTFLVGASIELTDSSDSLNISPEMIHYVEIAGTSSWQLFQFEISNDEGRSITLHPGLYNKLSQLNFTIRSAKKLPGPDHVPRDMLEMHDGNSGFFYLLDSSPEVWHLGGSKIFIKVIGNTKWNVYSLAQYEGDHLLVQSGTWSEIGIPSFPLYGIFSARKLGSVETVEPTQPAQIDGGWNTWEAWSQCQAQCESNGTRTRTRSCNNPAPEYGGLDCKESASQEEVCTSTERCPVNGGWSTWAAWSQCQAQCESNGTRTRTRSCNNPAPEYGGLDCSDSASQQEGCTNTLRCNNPARCQSAPTGYLPDPLDSTWFYQCQDIGGGEYIIHHMPCGPGTEWTALSQQTIRCYHISTTTTSTVTASINAIECPKLGVKYFHDSTNKHKHYQCVHGTKYHRDCQPGLCVPKTYTGGATHPCTQRCDNVQP